MPAATQQLTTKPTWIDRLMGRLYHANMSRTVTQMRIEANTQYQALVNDLDTPLDETFESLVAESFKRPELVGFRPSHVLFPRMKEKLGARKAAYSDSELKTMGKQCDQCRNISQCWLALRANANSADCARICPNSEALIAKAS